MKDTIVMDVARLEKAVTDRDKIIAVLRHEIDVLMAQRAAKDNLLAKIASLVKDHKDRYE